MQARRFPNLGIDGLKADASELAPRDAAFATAVYDAAIRQWLTLQHMVSMHVKQEWDELEIKMRGVLIAGAAQLIYLDRVPAHAVINH